ncbi:Hsp20/alpha crystallin family protein [Algiphilus sp.]|uniref:Hsp20/alpha crystallin family protein n=1 Tax=Algiphilus sp. TaxID=1872431 RepID=UPI001CA656A7|nr:Hsp20/alpha crystallin family protein [Algiphilus sp.]MBY8965949.1 Hsp20/alpha crystallin family protein [Algiphilus acroporae]MCI5062555.1 Hsp20/alpha crystallin family protein [Algiphilus sp.]MCI5103474.1 Hsp20/alpha crystallin family protein [Algiphilus sp.]
MDWKKLSPWNWFKKENQQAEAPLAERPVTYPAAAEPIARLHREMDRLFESLFELQPFGAANQLTRTTLWPRTDGNLALLRPQLDISENDTGYTITVEIPGVERDDVEVSVDDGVLLIRGEKRQSEEHHAADFHAIERRYGRFQRLLDLPEDTDTEQVAARFKDGVLSVHVPRRTDAHPRGRRIEVQGA